WAADL
ncbi:replication protein P, partial [Escherichia coli EC1856]